MLVKFLKFTLDKYDNYISMMTYKQYLEENNE